MPARWGIPTVIAAVLLWLVARTFTVLEAADLGDTVTHFMKSSRFVREFGFVHDDAYYEGCLRGEQPRYPIHHILGWNRGGQLSQLSLHASKGRQVIGLKTLMLVYPGNPSSSQREHLAHFMREGNSGLGGGESLASQLAAFLDSARAAYARSSKRRPVHQRQFEWSGLIGEFRTVFREYEQELSVRIGLPDARGWVACDDLSGVPGEPGSLTLRLGDGPLIGLGAPRPWWDAPERAYGRVSAVAETSA